MQITNWKKALARAVLDPAVGIRIAPLTESNEFRLFVTEILPGKKVGAHFHSAGIEIYMILAGAGTLHTALPAESNQKHAQQSHLVQTGDFFNIEPGVVHQLENTGTESLILVFGCPPEHLSSDRTLFDDLI